VSRLQEVEITGFLIIQLSPVSCSFSFQIRLSSSVSTLFCSTLSPYSSLNVGDQHGVTSQNPSLWDLWTSVTVTGFSGEYFRFSLVSIVSHMLHTILHPHATPARTNEQRAETFQKKSSFAVGENWTKK